MNLTIDREKMILLECILIILLIGSIFLIDKRIEIFSNDCKVNYTLSDECPCTNKLFNSSLGMFKVVNFSEFNITN
jgi:hypothetical protein